MYVDRAGLEKDAQSGKEIVGVVKVSKEKLNFKKEDYTFQGAKSNFKGDQTSSVAKEPYPRGQNQNTKGFDEI